MKGEFTPVMAAILMLVIIIALTAFTLAFFVVLQSTSTDKAQNATSSFASQVNPFRVEGVQPGAVYIRNQGPNTIKNNSVMLYVDNTPIEIGVDDILPGRTARVNISDGILPSGSYGFKVTSGLVQMSNTVDVPVSNVLKDPSFGNVRPPINIVVILDKSGSMNNNGNSFSDVRLAANTFVNLSDKDDRIAVVSFNSVATLDQSLTTDKDLVRNAINPLLAGGRTAIGLGILAANNELMTDTSGTKRFEIMLTDGIESENSNPELHAAEAAENNITIFTIGLGNAVNETQLQAIANLTKGEYFFVSSSSSLPGVFTDIGTLLGEDWVRIGDTSIADYAAYCLSPPYCSKFSSIAWPNTYVYQNTRIVFPGAYDAHASANVFVSGSVCSNECALLPQETCARNDARVRLVALDSYGNTIGQTTSSWGSSLGAGWIFLAANWTTPYGTSLVRMEIDAGDCCSTCSVQSVYVDDASLFVSKI